MNHAQAHAIRDIAHRWFAFFEGTTERLESHLDLFTSDIRLVHAGTHLLADGRDAMASWLAQLANDRDSHFIRDLKWRATAPGQAEVAMEVAYQIVHDDGSLGGSTIHYRADAVFDEQGQAAFAFLQKTPVAPNHAPVFRDSFAANRMGATLARLQFLCAQDRREQAVRELIEEDALEHGHALPRDIRAALPAAQIDVLDDERQTASLTLPSMPERRLLVVFAGNTGRYLSIRRIQWT